jgi:ABC-type lipoprotein export system ATPase subunit
VLDNVLAPGLAADVPNARDRAEELIARFGLQARRLHVPGELSTGERQRTALARALLNRPRLLLADEPTGNLDRENAEIVLRHLAEFADRGGGVLLVSHDADAVKHADLVIQLGRR